MTQKIDTEELIDEYFKRRDKITQIKTRAQVDKPALYIYEKEINKQLIDMNDEELIGLLNYFIYDKTKEGKSNYAMTTLVQMCSIFRKIFIFYDEEYESIPNPWVRKSMSAKEIKKRLDLGMNKISKERMKKAIKLIEENYDENRATLLKSIIALAYEGVLDLKEIPQIHESDISFSNRTIFIKERNIYLKVSEECLSLLKKVNEMLVLNNIKEKFDMVSWQGSYFKFPLKNNKDTDFQDRTLSQVSYILSGQLNRYVTNTFFINMKFRSIYKLGLYEKLVSVYGKQDIDNFILNKRTNRTNRNDYLNEANDYGYPFKNVLKLKSDLEEINI